MPKKFIAAAVSTLLLSACSTSHEQISYSPTLATPENGLTDADPALWVVKDEDTTIYLFGTVHVLKPGLSWFDEAVKDSFDASDELVTEMIEPDAATMQRVVTELALDKTGKTLRSKLDEDARGLYEKTLKEYAMPASAFDPLKPWFAAITITVLPIKKSGFKTEEGIEKVLTASAKNTKKKHIGLETMRQQLGYLDDLPEDAQIKFLNSAVKDLPEASKTLEKMVQQWADADLKSLGKTINAGIKDDILIDALLTKRNVQWADWIATRMKKPGTVFLAVGAGHLAGKDSVQKQLRTHKLKAKRVKY